MFEPWSHYDMPTCPIPDEYISLGCHDQPWWTKVIPRSHNDYYRNPYGRDQDMTTICQVALFSQSYVGCPSVWPVRDKEHSNEKKSVQIQHAPCRKTSRDCKMCYYMRTLLVAIVTMATQNVTVTAKYFSQQRKYLAIWICHPFSNDTLAFYWNIWLSIMCH